MNRIAVEVLGQCTFKSGIKTPTANHTFVALFKGIMPKRRPRRLCPAANNPPHHKWLRQTYKQILMGRGFLFRSAAPSKERLTMLPPKECFLLCRKEPGHAQMRLIRSLPFSERAVTYSTEKRTIVPHLLAQKKWRFTHGRDSYCHQLRLVERGINQAQNLTE